MRHDARNLGEELPVISREFCPPCVYECAESECNKVVYLVVEFAWAGWGEEQRGQVCTGWEVWEEETSDEAR